MEKKIVNVKKFGPFKYTETVTYHIGDSLLEQALDTLRAKLLFTPKKCEQKKKSGIANFWPFPRPIPTR